MHSLDNHDIAYIVVYIIWYMHGLNIYSNWICRTFKSQIMVTSEVWFTSEIGYWACDFMSMITSMLWFTTRVRVLWILPHESLVVVTHGCVHTGYWASWLTSLTIVHFIGLNLLIERRSNSTPKATSRGEDCPRLDKETNFSSSHRCGTQQPPSCPGLDAI